MSRIELTRQQVQTLLDQMNPRQRAAFQELNPQQKQALLQRLHEQHHPPSYYQVFRPELDSVAHDPLDPVKRYHDGVFVELDRTHGEGTLFHVTGDIIAPSGMRYEEKENYAPGQSTRLHRTTPLGFVTKADFDSGRMSAVMESLPTPTKQQGVNFWKKSDGSGDIEIIWTKENGEPYAPGEPRRPIMKCNEWTDLAVRTLNRQGILQSGR